jgi:hypothetical protein
MTKINKSTNKLDNEQKKLIFSTQSIKNEFVDEKNILIRIVLIEILAGFIICLLSKSIITFALVTISAVLIILIFLIAKLQTSKKYKRIVWVSGILANILITLTILYTTTDILKHEPAPIIFVTCQSPKTVHDHFVCDFRGFGYILYTFYPYIPLPLADKPINYVCELTLCIDWNAHSYFLIFFLKNFPFIADIMYVIAQSIDKNLIELKNTHKFEMNKDNEKSVTFSKMFFTRQVYIYHEELLFSDAKDSVDLWFDNNNLTVQLRGP